MNALFRPFRVIGYVTSNVPFMVREYGNENVVYLSVERAWQSYKCDKLKLLFMSQPLKKKIKCMTYTENYLFVSQGIYIEVFKRQENIMKMEPNIGKIIKMLSVGDYIFILGNEKKLNIYHINYLNGPQRLIEFENGINPTCICHPSTYLNKIVIGSEEGILQLWNFNTKTLIYTFPSFGSAICCMEPTPALDVIGIGLENGSVVIFNLKYNEIITVFKNASGLGLHLADELKHIGGPVTAISFKSGLSIPLMAAGGHSGVITIWNLEEKKLQTVINDAHDNTILSLYYFKQSPILMSSGNDNSLKQWTFDSLDYTAKLLKFRAGQNGSPTCIKFYNNGYKILSGAEDHSFWVFSIIQDQQSFEMSQKNKFKKNYKKHSKLQTLLKLPQIIQIDACDARERDWCNIITAHKGNYMANIWRMKLMKLSEVKFKKAISNQRKYNYFYKSQVTSVCLSRCGNYGIVGYNSGKIEKYNMQSGLHRGFYSHVTIIKNKIRMKLGHKCCISGLSSDNSNRYLISVSYDGYVKIWDFKKHALKNKLNVKNVISKLSMHYDTLLCAIATDDLILRIIDIENNKVVRTFRGHTDRINCIEISNDCRLLLSASMDESLRIWDIPSGHIFQVLIFKNVITSLSLNLSMEILATSHLNKKGIYLWSNQMIFGSGLAITPSEEPIDLEIPSLMPKEEEIEDDISIHMKYIGLENVEYYKNMKPVTKDLVVLSGVPRTLWHNLAHLDIIKLRNKPVKPPEKPKDAPFFLPNLNNLSGTINFELLNINEEKKDVSKSKVIRKTESKLLISDFIHYLRGMENSEHHKDKEFLEYLKTLSPVMLDKEILDINYIEIAVTLENKLPEAIKDLKSFLLFLNRQIKTKNDFEFIQALLKVVLKHHMICITEWPCLSEIISDIKIETKKSWTQVEDLLDNVQCMVNHFTNWHG